MAIPREKAQHFAARWKQRAEWLVKNQTLLSMWNNHVDQLAFALAMEESREAVEHLPFQPNAILPSLKEMATVYAFHLTPAHIPSSPSYFNEDRMLKPYRF